MDIRTLTFVNLIFLLLYAVIIVLNTGISGRMRGGIWFALSNLSRGVGWFLLSLTAFLPWFLSTFAGDLLLVIGLILLHRSLAEVVGRGRLAWKMQVVTGAAALAGISLISMLSGSQAASLIVISACLSVQLGLSTALLFSQLGPGMRGAVWFLGSILFLYGLAEMTRAVALVNSPAGVLQLSSGLLVAMMIGTLLANGGTAFGFLFLSAAQLRKELTRLAEHDSLTGLLNRRGLTTLVDRRLRASHREGEPVSAVMLDLDGMKTANDTWGHACGDEILCAVAKFLVGAVEGKGAVARLGGDEFLVVLPGVAEGGAVEIAEKLRRGIERLPMSRIQPKASFGVAAMTGISWEEAVRKSDQALYQAKNAGRNRVKCYA
ncbi:MAG: hypothetical protein NVSMB62_01540 [Acidobacteriaceae bacterium]